MTSIRKQVGVFLLLTIACTAPFWAFAIVTGDTAGGHGAYAVGAMWGPGLAALLTCWILGRPIASLGWEWGEWRWQALSYLWPLTVCIIVYGLVYVAGFGGFPNQTTVTALRKSLGWPTASTTLLLSGWFLLLATTGFVRGLASALGEEIGWRGFLTPLLCRHLGFTRGALLTGAVWAVWHFPLIFFSNYDTATPWWFATPCFVVEVLSLAVIMAWVRLRSGSLWTGAIAHASINLFNQGFFAPLTAPHGPATAYVIDESGIVLPVVLLSLAMLVWVKQRDQFGDPAARKVVSVCVV